MTSKVCTKCGLEKPVAEFGKHKDAPDGLRYSCKPCFNQRSKSWRRRNPEYQKEWSKNNRHRHKNAQLKYKYGITEADYKKMLQAQNYSCKICGLADSQQRHGLHVDHCHATGKIRGLLCRRCNTALGFCEDNIDVLANMIKYLIGG